jgi:hypothetical protein
MSSTNRRYSTPTVVQTPFIRRHRPRSHFGTVQVQVTNGGAVALPTGIPLPGSYDPHDTSGILVQLWQIQATPSQLFYIAPGGPVLLPGGTGDW